MENDNLRDAKDSAEKNYQIAINDNHALNMKLENLESVFIGNPIPKGDAKNQQRLISDEYMASNVRFVIKLVTLRKHRVEAAGQPTRREGARAASPVAREE